MSSNKEKELLRIARARTILAVIQRHISVFEKPHPVIWSATVALEESSNLIELRGGHAVHEHC